MAVANLRASESPYNFVGARWVCAYCGEPSDTIDHCTPAWFVESNPKLIARYHLFKVAACMDCNVRAGALVDQTFAQRRRRISQSIRQKHRRLLSVADWEPEEIKRLGRGLRDHVQRGFDLASVLRRRLRVLDDPNPPADVPFELMQHAGVGEADFEEDLSVEMRPVKRQSAPASADTPKRRSSVLRLVSPPPEPPPEVWPPVRLFTEQMRLPL